MALAAVKRRLEPRAPTSDSVTGSALPSTGSHAIGCCISNSVYSSRSAKIYRFFAPSLPLSLSLLSLSIPYLPHSLGAGAGGGADGAQWRVPWGQGAAKTAWQNSCV